MASTSHDPRYQDRGYNHLRQDLHKEPEDTDNPPKERRRRRKKKKEPPPPPPPVLLTPAQASTLLAHLNSFLVVTIHQLLYHRNLYPKPSFLLTRSHNLAVYQSRHPGVCKWVDDSCAAVGQRVVAGEVERVVFVVYGPQEQEGRPNWVDGSGNSTERDHHNGSREEEEDGDEVMASSPPLPPSPTKGNNPLTRPMPPPSEDIYEDDRVPNPQSPDKDEPSPMIGVQRDLGEQNTIPSSPPKDSAAASGSLHDKSSVEQEGEDTPADPFPAPSAPPILERWTISLPLLPTGHIHPPNHPSRRPIPSHRQHLARFRNPYHRVRPPSLINAIEPFEKRFQGLKKRRGRPSRNDEMKDESRDLERRQKQLEKLGGIGADGQPGSKAPAEDKSERTKTITSVNWGDVKQGLRAAIVSISRAAENLSKQEDLQSSTTTTNNRPNIYEPPQETTSGRTFSLAIELKPNAPAPLENNSPWLAAEADLQKPQNEEEEERGIGASRIGSETSWIRNVQAGPLHFECWVERGMDWGLESESEGDEGWEDEEPESVRRQLF